MKGPLKKILIVVAVLGLAALGYYFFKNKSAAPALPPLTSSSPSGVPITDQSTASVGDEFLSQLLGLNTIRLDTGILTGSPFLALQDFSVTLPPITDEGRANPFKPIGSDITAISGTTTPINDQTVVPGTQAAPVSGFPATTPTKQTVPAKKTQ